MNGMHSRLKVIGLIAGVALTAATNTWADTAAVVAAPAAAAVVAAPAAAPAAAAVVNSGDTAWVLVSTALVLLSFFGFGLLLSLTPCVFPMIPILSGIIVNHGHAVSHLRAFVLSLAYVLGMAVAYAAVGVAAGLSGTLLSAAL